MSEQAEAVDVVDNVEQLCDAVGKLGYIPLEPSKCEAVIPPVIVKKKTTLTIMLKNKNNNPVTDASKELNVLIENIKDEEAIQVRAIKEVGGGRYEASFTASRCGYYMISIIVDGHHIPGSPYKTPVDRDYSKMTEQDCYSSQVMTHFGETKFGFLNDVAIAPTGEVVIVDGHKAQIIILDDKLNLLNVIGGDRKSLNPFGMAMIDNAIAVSDHCSNKVKKFSLQGDLLSVIDYRSNKSNEFHYISKLAFNSSNKLLYVSGGDNRIQVFNQDNKFLFSFKSRESNIGPFQYSVSIAFDYSNNNVLVTDGHTNCIQLFTHDGRLIQKIKTSHKPFIITSSPTGYFITGHHEGDDNAIRVWSPTYQLINQFGKKGSERGEFKGINGIAIDSNGTMYITESDNKRLQIIYNN